MTDCVHSFIMPEFTMQHHRPPLVEVFCATCWASLSIGIGEAKLPPPGHYPSLDEVDVMLQKVLAR